MIVVTVGTPEHKEVVASMVAQLGRDRAAFAARYAKYLPAKEASVARRT